MTLPLLAFVLIALLTAGYTLYGRLIARHYRLDDQRITPAERQEDGIDFVPTRPFYLLGQHFSAIAAAGPIAGPILACQQFGWLPCMLWIGFGVIFIGAVHDFSALVASVRHGARSIADIVKETLGPRSWLAILTFIWIALVYVIVAFADITASTFIGATEELAGAHPFNAGGAVAAAATIYLALAMLMGLVQRLWRPPLWILTLLFVPATLGAVWVGTQVSTWLVLPHAAWVALILAYCFAASLVPVWLLLQPRGYLGGFVLYLALAIGVGGIFFGGDEIRQPATVAAPLAGVTGSIFPFLFVTIACGACSGFHGLICSGTTSKQIARESHCRAIGYGAMLLEGFVALIALATIMIIAPDAAKGVPPGTIYGNDLAHFLSVLIGEDSFRFAATFGAMAFSTFVFDTLDVATRLGRYILQELAGTRSARSAWILTAVTAAVPLAIVLGAGKDSFKAFWTLFGTSNQLLAALTLLAISVWLKRTGSRIWFTMLPMCFVMTITIWALVAQGLQFFRTLFEAQAGSSLALPLANGIVSLLLVLLALFLIFESLRAMAATPAQLAPVGSSDQRAT